MARPVFSAIAMQGASSGLILQFDGACHRTENARGRRRGKLVDTSLIEQVRRPFLASCAKQFDDFLRHQRLTSHDVGGDDISLIFGSIAATRAD